MELVWKNIDIEVLNHNKKYKQKRIKLVSNACGHARQGLLAIMGPSGSGKTTLIQALAGRIPKGSYTTGSITFDGQDRNIETWRDLVGFVDQDDTIYEQLTAHETVTYAAKFRLKDKSADIDKKVTNLFKKLAITHILGCKMSKVSGGERKRVMVAIELITDPKIIFLDEPTSGLDNNTTVTIIQLLKELSEEGRAIVFTIHQPDDITTDEFDEVLLLSQGRSVYMGKMTNCEKHLMSKGFEKEPMESMSNFAMKVLSVEPGVYHETAESNKLDVLVNEVKERYSFSEEEKRTKKSNDKYVNLVFNFDHIMLLLKRRFRLELFSKRGHGLKASILSRPSYMVNSYLSDIQKAEYSKIIKEKHILEFFLEFISSIGWLIAYRSLLAISVFSTEHYSVKREIAVNTYSITSYFFSAFLFEFSKGLPTFIVTMIGLRVIVGNCISLLFVFLCLVTYFITIMATLSICSLFTGIKMTALVSTFFNALNFNTIDITLQVAKWRELGKAGKLCFFSYFLGLVPNTALNMAFLMILKSRHLKKFLAYSNLVDPLYEFSKDYAKGTELQLSIFKKTLIGIEMPIVFNYVFALVLFVAYFVLCIRMLSFHLRPNYRMSLNKSSEQES